MGNPEVYVAGLGVVSALGFDLEANLHALQEGQSGIGPIEHLETKHRDTFAVGEVKASNAELAAISGCASTASRTAMLSLIAAKEAIRFADSLHQSRLRTGFISATSVGGMDLTEGFYETFSKDKLKGRLRNVVSHECGSITEVVAKSLSIHHYINTISTACSSSANAIFQGARLIISGHLDLVVAGGTEALTRFTLNGFNSLMILDKAPCKPLDQDRKGLNLGEGSGYLLLASEKALSQLGTTPYCKLTGWHNANDAYHQTASSPDGNGSFMAMEGAIRKSGIRKEDIGYVNLHGTGTQNNDLSEGTALRRIYGDDLPKLSSTKAFTGHTLGASGAIEAVYSVMSVNQGYVYPNLRFVTPMQEVPLYPEKHFLVDKGIRHVMSNSFGFGGNCSSLIFSAC